MRFSTVLHQWGRSPVPVRVEEHLGAQSRATLRAVAPALNVSGLHKLHNSIGEPVTQSAHKASSSWVIDADKKWNHHQVGMKIVIGGRTHVDIPLRYADTDRHPESSLCTIS